MPEDKMEELLETYNGARIKSGREKRVVCQQDREIYDKYRSGVLLQHLAEEYGRSYWYIWKSIRLAAEEVQRYLK